MLSWSLNFIMRAFDSSGALAPVGLAGAVVAALNMLVQVFLSLCFGDKSILKTGGKR